MNLKTGNKLQQSILQEKIRGTADLEIGQKYGVTFKYIEKLITKHAGINISKLNISKDIKTLAPKDFEEEQTTVWSFKHRGNWATHSGEYRGNWSPYIPRNVILKYSKPGDIVLDYFCGAGTTAVESKLLGRRCIAIDINDKVMELAKKNMDFYTSQQLTFIDKKIAPFYEPELLVADARKLSFLQNDSIDLICAHPPYANIIQYTEHKQGDLSHFDTEDFLREMEKVANESYRVLKPGRQCAILIGDMRRHKYVIPLGFKLINLYIRAGFKLKELVIKRQHNCKTTGFWYTNSIKFNFLLLAHEYLPIFEKPVIEIPEVKEEFTGYKRFKSYLIKPIVKQKLEELETSTVWIFPEDDLERLLNKNVIDRYIKGNNYKVIDIDFSSKKTLSITDEKKEKDLLFIKSSFLVKDKEYVMQDVVLYIEQLRDILERELSSISKDGYYVIQVRDIRVGKYLEPLAKRIFDSICLPDFLLKEIVIVTTEDKRDKQKKELSQLNISHQYILVYKKKE